MPAFPSLRHLALTLKQRICRHDWHSTGDFYHVPDTETWLVLRECSRCNDIAIFTNN